MFKDPCLALLFRYQFIQSVRVIMQKSRRSHHFMQANVAFANAAL